MTSFLDIHYGYDMEMMQTIYYNLNADTLGMVPTWHYRLLRGYSNYYLITIR